MKKQYDQPASQLSYSVSQSIKTPKKHSYPKPYDDNDHHDVDGDVDGPK